MSFDADSSEGRSAPGLLRGCAPASGTPAVPIVVTPRKAARRRLHGLTPAARVALYGMALDAWTASLEQREVDAGATRPQARLNVRQGEEAALRRGYPARLKRERDAFLDLHVAAAMA